ncbi:MAG: hypothetical protein NTV43_07865 [Methylococcales bacterium]|nr:hypothetical protein [Methylococcales bacterium]
MEKVLNQGNYIKPFMRSVLEQTKVEVVAVNVNNSLHNLYP